MTSTPTRRLIIDHQSFRLVAALPGGEQARGAGVGVRVGLKEVDRYDGAGKKMYFCSNEREREREFTAAVKVFDCLTLTLSTRKRHSRFCVNCNEISGSN